MRATVIAHAVASLIVVAQPLAPANAQDTATAVSAATQNTPSRWIGHHSIRRQDH